MKKSKIIILTSAILTFAGIIVITILSQFQYNKNTLNMESLRLTQGNTYVSISNNDMSEYSRIIPFYFSYIPYSGFDVETPREQHNVESITEQFEIYLTTMSIHFKNSPIIFTTNYLNWSAFEISPNEYNITLIISPEIEDLQIDGIMLVDKIVFNDKYSFEFHNYIIEAKETISEKVFFITDTPIETTINESLVSTGLYGILPLTGETINGFELIFPNNFSNIIKYEIVDANISDEGIFEYRVQIFFSENERNVVFRPFIKILHGNNQIAWAIPPLPTFIN
jgi:hypothetical protein